MLSISKKLVNNLVYVLSFFTILIILYLTGDLACLHSAIADNFDNFFLFHSTFFTMTPI